MNIPDGTVTFLFTDIESSTKLAQQFPDIIQTELEKHHSILNEIIKSHNGFIFEIVGDAFCTAFGNPKDAVRSAYEIQKRLLTENFNGISIKVRIGIHTGKAEWSGKRYIGYITLARTHRVMSAAYGGQILVSTDCFDIIRDTTQNNISFRDLGERRLKDLIQPMRIFQIISPDLPSEFPPLKTLDARPNNLPVQLTNFIGREKEIEEVKKLLSETHLLTLAGPGGTGKTRLCLQAAAEVIDDFANGVWFVDLAPLKDEKLLLQTVAQVIGVKENPETELLNTITDFLKEKELLILLDNCEHIIDSCSLLAETLISKCPKLKIMATSREALRCRGELMYYVTSLELPDLNPDTTFEKLTQYESVRFFIEKAVSIKPGFQVSTLTAPYVAEICHKLDGIPLAIELAAARVKVLSVEQISERLNDRFNLLISGNRTALPRQQTLRALIDWSHDLLSAKEKILWNRLSVFAGGWTIEAAEKVCSCEELKQNEILDILSNLVDKSLVIFNEQSNRYRMLETIRQYGEEQLDNLSELDEIMKRHLTYYVEFAGTAKINLSGFEQKYWMNRLDDESSNFQVALVSSIVRGNRLKGIQLVLFICRYWEVRGFISQAKNWLKEFLNSPEDIPEMEKAGLLQWSGTFEWITGNYENAKSFYEKSFLINKELNNKTGIAVSLNNLGLIYNITGEHEKSKEHTEQSYKIFSELGDKALMADSLLNLGSTLINLNEPDKARSVFEECLKVYREIGDARGVGMILTNIGSLYGMKNEYETSRIYFEESLAIQRELQDRRNLAYTVGNLGSILSSMGHHKKAQEYLEESIRLNTEIGNKKGLSDSLNMLGFDLFKVGDVTYSIYNHKESLKLKIELSDSHGISVCILGIAEALSGSDESRSALLIGAAEEVRKSSDGKFDEETESIFNSTFSLLKEKLGEKKFEAAFEEGKKMKFDEAVKLALASSE
ncbi:MAG: tetratricopeptide repeat protein [Ignavibacteria bacterium]|nr:tetratricopeptide repeat protein [Ignavibacteria bacterium]